MQDYKLIVRGLSSQTVLDQSGQLVIQNFSEFMSYLNEQYLSQGYKVIGVDTVRVIPATPEGSPAIYEFAYHLVKEVEAKSK